MKKFKQWAAALILGSLFLGGVAAILTVVYLKGGFFGLGVFGLILLTGAVFVWSVETYVEHGFPWEN